VNNAPDSLKVAKNYVLGQISDDYGLSKLQVVYYEERNRKLLDVEQLLSRKVLLTNLYFRFQVISG
jgi:hypothetical protein